MISRLSDLLRITFDRSGEPKVTLKEEIEFLQKYLDIEQTRFQDRLAVHVDVDPDALDGEVPRMILQPLVENAIKHGIAGRNRRRQRPNHRRAATASALWMQVRDNGGGLQVAHAEGAAHGRRPLEHAGATRMSLRTALPPGVLRQARRTLGPD